ncbi:hypothetical protein SAMD00019534_027580 [Acytostelium subglobosum LB1]|uniref:hypothetical protein n=1 Tax=Acytostelium subglobosum LB1 TaxID=1410327 RepID=UPI000644C45F|nr:hypothetical protein SAMD00019534_027580 [Acytostelium subglobosum LB1]GAM19583.1 hypothetical protein SAMD00019534_027580 [Acytostelium subglobosum LB1]|eukprot:XP_012757510.1 hypothetical protein SAMD00019534_027580 [Acytostelium subglobosum LB1]
MGLSKREIALQRRNARHFWGTMLIPGLDILRSDLIRVKEESDSRLILFISDIKRSLNNVSTTEKAKALLLDLLVVASSFLSTDHNQIECGKYAEELLKKLNAKEMDKVEGVNREKVVNLLFIISNFGRIKEFVSVENEKIQDKENTSLSHVTTPVIKPLRLPESQSEPFVPPHISRMLVKDKENEGSIQPRVIESSSFFGEDEEDFISSSSDSESSDDDDDESDLPLATSITQPKVVTLQDPRVNSLKTDTAFKKIGGIPLIRSASYSPQKAIEIKKELSGGFKKLARSYTDIPTLRTLVKQEEEQMVICRICEERIETSLFEKHSKLCATTKQEDMKAMNIDDQLRAIGTILADRGQFEIKSLVDNAIEMGAREEKALLHDLKTKLILETAEDLKGLLKKIETLILDKSVALVNSEQAINSSPILFRSPSRGMISPRTREYIENCNTNVGGRSRSDSDPCRPSTLDLKTSVGIPTIDDFQIIKPITKGGFGKVYLAKKKKTGDIYAIKRLKKSDMIKKNQVDHVKVERNILAYTSNPFVVKMYYSFQTKDYFYLVMEYVHGGDCFSLLQNLGGLDEDMAKMIIAETVLALEYLHGLGITHRDLKPDNLLIDKNGHVKLTDFGLSKVGLLDIQGVVPPSYLSPKLSSQVKPKNKRLLPLMSTKKMPLAFSSPSIPNAATAFFPFENNTNSSYDKPHQQQQHITSEKVEPPHSPNNKRSRMLSCVGTPDYLAPEILLGIGHGKEVDWFSVGVMLYEFLTGLPPFSADTVEATFQNILQRNIKYPDDMSDEARDIIDKLLALNPQSRLGYNGADEVKSHPFFQDIDWATIRTQNTYFKPVLQDLQDTSYFDARKPFYDLRISDDSNSNSPQINIPLNGEIELNKLVDDFLYVNFQTASRLSLFLSLSQHFFQLRHNLLPDTKFLASESLVLSKDAAQKDTTSIPVSVRRLILDNFFNLQLHSHVIPHSTTELILGQAFDQPLDEHSIPSSVVECLTKGYLADRFQHQS